MNAIYKIKNFIELSPSPDSAMPTAGGIVKIFDFGADCFLQTHQKADLVSLPSGSGRRNRAKGNYSKANLQTHQKADLVSLPLRLGMAEYGLWAYYSKANLLFEHDLTTALS